MKSEGKAALNKTNPVTPPMATVHKVITDILVIRIISIPPPAKAFSWVARAHPLRHGITIILIVPLIIRTIPLTTDAPIRSILPITAPIHHTLPRLTPILADTRDLCPLWRGIHPRDKRDFLFMAT
ncbi:hypothetical protein JIR001_16210 [Polycladomyces abyssicola]|uniref:Uncharacterized protein n=1 Tax=Polycladomyces abyssicola TaxID=1125966 RepID=A0A8D5UFN9_9BACL|nr:hypothetical protein JIR001_16210 [Polycladomyces abyssicola]